MVSHKYVLLALSLLLAGVWADVSHLRGLNRATSNRLQRLESYPYAAAGYTPNREFNLPQEQPLFPLGNQVPQDTEERFNDNQKNNFGFDNQSETQGPQLTYGAPARLRQAPANRLRQQQQQQQQQKQFHNAPQRLVQQSRPIRFRARNQPQKSANKQRLIQTKPARLTAASQKLQAEAQEQPQFQTLAQIQIQPQPQPQTQFQVQPQNQPLAQLQTQPEIQAQPQLFYTTAPQLLLNNGQQFLQQPAPAARLTATLQPQFQQFSVLPQRQPARLTDNREDADEEDEEDTRAIADDAASADIETSNKTEDKKIPNQTQTPATIAYYPAGAVSFVQPISANYIASPAAYQNPYNIAAAAPLLQQPLSFAGAGVTAQLQAW